MTPTLLKIRKRLLQLSALALIRHAALLLPPYGKI